MKKFLSIFETIGLLSSSSIIAVPTLSNIKTNSILKKENQMFNEESNFILENAKQEIDMPKICLA